MSNFGIQLGLYLNGSAQVHWVRFVCRLFFFCFFARQENHDFSYANGSKIPDSCVRKWGYQSRYQKKNSQRGEIWSSLLYMQSQYPAAPPGQCIWVRTQTGRSSGFGVSAI